MDRQMKNKIRELMKNTGINWATANTILICNSWDLFDSYKEVEQLASSGNIMFQSYSEDLNDQISPYPSVNKTNRSKDSFKKSGQVKKKKLESNSKHLHSAMRFEKTFHPKETQCQESQDNMSTDMSVGLAKSTKDLITNGSVFKFKGIKDGESPFNGESLTQIEEVYMSPFSRESITQIEEAGESPFSCEATQSGKVRKSFSRESLTQIEEIEKSPLKCDSLTQLKETGNLTSSSLMDIQAESYSRSLSGHTRKIKQTKCADVSGYLHKQSTDSCNAMEIGETADVQQKSDTANEKCAFYNNQQSKHVAPHLKREQSKTAVNSGVPSKSGYSGKIFRSLDTHKAKNDQTFVLPDLRTYDFDTAKVLSELVIETGTLLSLEEAGCLNWWAEKKLCQKFYPISTRGDGNCLLHAASIALWGVHDKNLELRNELFDTLTKASYMGTLYRRWRYQQTLYNKQFDLVFTDAEWGREWENILNLASPVPLKLPESFTLSSGDKVETKEQFTLKVYHSLEEFHVFVLAHVLGRPIIIIADTILKDTNGDALAPIPFSGIYLPFEAYCYYKAPLLLSYDASHFSPLVTMKNRQNGIPAAIPLQDIELNLLPVHYHLDPGPNVDWSKEFEDSVAREEPIRLLDKFLNLDRLPYTRDDASSNQTKQERSQSVNTKYNARQPKQTRKGTREKRHQSFVASKKAKKAGLTMSRDIFDRDDEDTVLVAKLVKTGNDEQKTMFDNYLADVFAMIEEHKQLQAYLAGCSTST